MKTIFNSSLVLLVLSLFAFVDDKPLEKVAKLKTVKGEVIDLYFESNMSQGQIGYKNESGKRLHIDYDDVEWLESENSIYLRQLTNEKKNDYSLLELIAINEKYKMLGWYGAEKNTIYIFDMNNHLIEEFKSFLGEVSHNEKKARIVEKISQYFGDCNELMKTLRENAGNKKNELLWGVSYSANACPGAPEKSALMK